MIEIKDHCAAFVLVPICVCFLGDFLLLFFFFLAPFFCFVLFLNLPAVIHSINFSGAL